MITILLSLSLNSFQIRLALKLSNLFEDLPLACMTEKGFLPIGGKQPIFYLRKTTKQLEVELRGFL